MEYWVGVDVALRVSGVVVYNRTLEEIKDSTLVKYGKKVEDISYESFLDIKNLYLQVFRNIIPEDFKRLVFVIEGPVQWGHVKSILKINFARDALFAAVDYAYGDVLDSVYVPTVNRWKHKLVGRNNAKKSEIEDYIRTKYGHIRGIDNVFGFDDTVDAMGLVLWGIEHESKLLKE